jgi:signal transduction histidine kinase
MSVDNLYTSEAEAVESAVHALAQRTSSLLAFSRSVIVPVNESSSVGETYDGISRESLYRILKWRFENGEISPAGLLSLTESMLREICHFDILVQNLIGYYTREEPLEPRKQMTPLVPLLEEVIDLFDFAAAEKGVAMSLLVPGEPAIRIDHDLIHRMLVNLIDNAVKYSYSTSTTSKQRFISVMCRRHSVEGSIRITVSSYGVGVLESEITSGEIFNYGVRGALAKDRERRGMGIGLAEAKRIAEAHGGSLELDSQLKHGDTYLTSVNVVLPPV